MIAKKFVVQNSGVVQREETEAQFVDKLRAEHMLIGNRQRAIAIRTFDRNWRSEAARIGKRIETREVGEEERAV